MYLIQCKECRVALGIVFTPCTADNLLCLSCTESMTDIASALSLPRFPHTNDLNILLASVDNYAARLRQLNWRARVHSFFTEG